MGEQVGRRKKGERRREERRRYEKLGGTSIGVPANSGQHATESVDGGGLSKMGLCHKPHGCA